MESVLPIPRHTVPIEIQASIKDAKVKAKFDPRSKDPFVAWRTSRLFHTGRMEMVYSFGVRETCYKVELSKIWYPKKEPCWGVNVRHQNWNNLLVILERLPTGETVNWGNAIEKFFPQDGQMPGVNAKVKKEGLGMQKLCLEDPDPTAGIKLLVTILMQLSEIVHDVSRSAQTAAPSMPAIEPETLLGLG